MRNVDQYSYLWDGSQAGWVLLRLLRSTSSLTVSFPDGSASVKDARALRATLPEFGSFTAQDTLRRLAGRPTVELGSFEQREARRIVKALEAQGLTVKESALNEVCYIPFNESTKSILLIDEDEELAAAVEQKALASGVRTRDVEA